VKGDQPVTPIQHRTMALGFKAGIGGGEEIITGIGQRAIQIKHHSAHIVTFREPSRACSARDPG
jgi:hypothetical protein